MLLGDENDVVDQRADNLGGDRARRLDRNAFRQRVAAHRQRLRLDHIVHRWVKRRLHANDLDVRLERFGRDRDAGNQTASADRHDQYVEIGH